MKIETILLMHHTHIDFGYTDHQQTAMAKLRSFVDDALDAIERSSGFADDAKFRWTQEVTLPLSQWWQSASSKKRARLVAAIENGQFDVGAMPVNTTDFADIREWEYMLDHLPKSIRAVARPRTIMQNDINGIPRRAMEMAWDRGVRNLWMGPNSYYGMPPEPAPFAFYWEVAPGKKILVWCNSSYNDGTFLFNENWRQGPVPAAHDLHYRQPAEGDIFACDDDSLARAHALLTEKLALLTGGENKISGTDGFTKCRTRTDYPYKTLVTSVAGQWRCDNDPPFAALSDFVEAWNRKGYKPRLRLVTVTEALETFAQEAKDLPVRRGIWSNYWSNGLATTPREIACAREARRTLTSACVPQLGKLTAAQKKQRQDILYNLMMVDEHTFAAWDSAADPFCPNAMAQIAEKSVFAYRALEGAKMLRCERVRHTFKPEFGTVTLFNSTDFEKVHRLDMPANALRGEYKSLLDETADKKYGLYLRPGRSNFLRPDSESDLSEDNVARTFGDVCPDMRIVSDPIVLGPHEAKVLKLSGAPTPLPAALPDPIIQTDEKGWPVYVAFTDSHPLLNGVAGLFKTVRARGIAPRWTYKDVFDADTEEERESLYKELFMEIDSEYGEAECSRDRNMIIFTQKFAHPSLRLGRRTLMIDLCTRRIFIDLKVDRLADFTPEIFYVGFHAPVEKALPVATLVGQPFTPIADNLPGTCKDFFCIDGVLQYGSKVKWNWFARDTSLVCIGNPRPSTRRESLPEEPRDFWAQVFDNTWDTNFDPNVWGRMHFRFDIALDSAENPGEFFEALATEPVEMIYTRDPGNRRS